VKVEKIPLLSAASCADDLNGQQRKENVCLSAETVEMPSSIDDTRKTGSETLLPFVSSGSAVPSPHCNLQTRNNSNLTTQVQNTVQVNTAPVEKHSVSSHDGETQAPVYDRGSAGTGEKSPQIYSALNSEAEDSRAELGTSVQHEITEPQVNSAPLSKAIVNTAAQVEHKSLTSVDSAAASERQSHEKNKPKLVNVRRAADGPDQNCRTQ